MKQTKQIMGMPITVEVVDGTSAILAEVFSYFERVDERFSTYKPGSEISKINRGELTEKYYSREMREVLKLSEETKKQTTGYFDIKTPEGKLDPSGLVKGWAIFQASKLLKQNGFDNFFVDAGGDVQASRPSDKQPWTVGIRHPFELNKIVKILNIHNEGIATSGSYERGNHIYNPITPRGKIDDIVSLTVIGPNIYEADRFATAAFAMGNAGIEFIESASGLEGYIIDRSGMGTETSGFNNYLIKNVNIKMEN